MRALLRLHPDAVWIADRAGNLPLHLAVSCDSHHTVVNELLKVDTELCETVGGQRPCAHRAAAETPNAAGLLPLHIAVEHAMKIKDQKSKIKALHADQAGNSWASILEAVVGASETTRRAFDAK